MATLAEKNHIAHLMEQAPKPYVFVDRNGVIAIAYLITTSDGETRHIFAEVDEYNTNYAVKLVNGEFKQVTA